MLTLAFAPQDPDSFELKLATYGYQNCWHEHHKKIVAKFHELTGLSFQQKDIHATVIPGTVNNSGMTGAPMLLGAGYHTADEKLAVISHELAHRLLGGNQIWVDVDAEDALYNEHRRIYLFLFEAWCDLFGKAFADAAVAREFKDAEYYEAAWKWALKKNRKQRADALRAIIHHKVG